MAIKRVEGFVIKRIPIRETSLIVTLYSKEVGKFKGLVKGVRREKNPLTGRFEPFSRLEIVYYEKLRSDTHLISDTVLLETNDCLRQSLMKFSFASYLTELVDLLFGVYDPNPEVFFLMEQIFQILKESSSDSILRASEVKLLELAGLLPILTHCVICRKEELDQVFFSPNQGGIICSHCDKAESATIKISHGALQSLLYYLRSDIDQAVTLKLSEQIGKELEKINYRFLIYRLDYPPRASRFLAEMKSFFNHHKSIV